MPTETRDHDPYWGRMFQSSAELEALKEAAAERAREAYDATTRAIASGLHHLGGERDAPVDKFKAGLATEMQKQAAPAAQNRPAAAPPKAAIPNMAPRTMPSDKRGAATDFGAGVLLDLIPRGEGTAGTRGYDATYNNADGRNYPSGWKPPTELSINEWERLMPELVARNGGSVVGRYQILDDKVPDLKRWMGLSGSEIGTPALQDRMARELLFRRGYDDFLAGRITAEQLQRNLAKEWSSLPDVTGKSYYGGAARISSQELQAALARSKAEYDQITASGRRLEGHPWR